MKISLIDVCDFQGGTQPPKEEWIDHPEPGYIRMLQIRDFTQPDKDHIEYIREKKTIKTCNDNDILIGRYGASVGKILTGLSGAYNVAMVKTIPDNKVICTKYLFHYLNSPYFQNYILSVGSRAAQAGFNKEDLKNALIFLPSLDEQNCIVLKLDLLAQLISLRKQQLAKLDELVKARFVEMFGDPASNLMKWETPPLSDCLNSIENGKSFVCESEPRKDNWPAVLKLSAVTYGDYRAEENKSVLDVKDFIQTAEIHTGDLLFTRKNTPELVGMSAYVFETEPYLMMPDLIFRLNTNEKCDKIFLWQLINHDLFRTSISNLASGSAKSMSNISKERLSNLQIICPPVELQSSFAEFVMRTHRQKLTIQQSLDKLEVLRKSLMQEYFG